MGLCLKTNWLWMITHFVLSLSIPFFISITLGCIKQPELTTPMLGEESSFEELDQIIDEALENLNPYSIRQGQRVLREQFMTVELPPRQKMGLQLTTVTQVKLFSDVFFILYQDEIQNFFDEEPVWLVEEVITLPPVSCANDVAKSNAINLNFPIIPLRQKTKARLKNQSINLSLLKKLQMQKTQLQKKEATAMSEQPIIRISLHNLSSQKTMWPIPDFIQSRPQCGGVPNCQMPATEISYRLALWTSDTEYESFDSKLIVSTDAPYFGLVLSDCREQQPIIGDRDYFIRVCDEVSDFIYGEPPSCS